MGTTPAGIQNSVDPLAELRSQTASVRFFLTESEFNEAKLARKTWLNNRRYRIASRVICAYGVYFFIAAPSWFGEPWPVLVRRDPLIAIETFAFAALDAYVVLGMPGIAALNRLLNRFDLQREIALTQDQVKIRRGSKSWRRSWDQFRCYYETPGLYILQTRGTQFWTVPKRAFEPGAEPLFRQILESNLRRKEAANSAQQP